MDINAVSVVLLFFSQSSFRVVFVQGVLTSSPQLETPTNPSNLTILFLLTDTFIKPLV